MSDQQLWSDDRIIDVLTAAGINRTPPIEAISVVGKVGEIRDEYETRITELEAQLAKLRSGRWILECAKSPAC